MMSMVVAGSVFAALFGYGVYGKYCSKTKTAPQKDFAEKGFKVEMTTCGSDSESETPLHPDVKGSISNLDQEIDAADAEYEEKLKSIISSSSVSFQELFDNEGE